MMIKLMNVYHLHYYKKIYSFDYDNDKKEDNNIDDGNIDESDTIYIDNANKIEIV